MRRPLPSVASVARSPIIAYSPCCGGDEQGGHRRRVHAHPHVGRVIEESRSAVPWITVAYFRQGGITTMRKPVVGVMGGAKVSEAGVRDGPRTGSADR